MKLADWIITLINENCKGDSFFEVFAGTSVVSSKIADKMKTLILNDTLEANQIIYEAFYSKELYNLEKLKNYKHSFDNLQNIEKKDYFSEYYGGKYFSISDCIKIENIRNIIEKEKNGLNKKEYAILLASLIYSMDKCANTVGHFDAYIRSDNLSDKFQFDLIEPLNFPNTNIEIYGKDANEIAKKITADIVYIDPPYNSRQYCQFYHIYETVVRWDNPELHGVALKPAGRHLSDYCRNNAPVVFTDLIENLDCKYIVVSYNNTYKSKSSSSKNKISLEKITEILEARGNVKIFSKNHSFFNAGKTYFPDHKEYLFISEVKK